MYVYVYIYIFTHTVIYYFLTQFTKSAHLYDEKALNLLRARRNSPSFICTCRGRDVPSLAAKAAGRVKMAATGE